MLGPQFEQASLFPKDSVKEPRRPVIRPEDWISEHGEHRPESDKFKQQRLAMGEHPVNVYHGGTYPMMMTAGEVKHQFQPLDADRHIVPDGSGAEYDHELWERKANEAWDAGPGEHGHDVAPSIVSYGYDMRKPVSLSDGTLSHKQDDKTMHSAGRGYMGKYQILGGHHRIAVMDEERPHDLMSVQWKPHMLDVYKGSNY